MGKPSLEQMSGVTGYLNRLMSRTMDGVVIFDDVGRIVFANASFGRLVGQQPGRLLKHSFLGLVRENERATVLRRWRAMVSGRDETYRVHLNTAHGERLLVIVQNRLELASSLHLAYVRDLTESAELSRQMHELGGLAGIARAFASITDQSEVTRQLVNELATLLGVEKCYIGIYDAETDLISPLAPAFGIGDEDLQILNVRLSDSGHLSQIYHSGQPRVSNEAAKDHLLDPTMVARLQISTLLTVPLSTGGRVLGFLTVINRYGASFTDDDVRPLQIFAAQVAVAIDNARLVSELGTQKDLALGRASQLEALVNSIVDVVWIVSPDGSLVSVNESGRRLIGVAADADLPTGAEYLHRLAVRHVNGQEVTDDELPWKKVAAGAPVRNTEIAIRPVDGAGDVVLSVSGAAVRGQDGALALMVFVGRDVTELRDLQRQKDEFLSVASHELRTPLTTLRGCAQQLLWMFERGGEIDHTRAIDNLKRVIRQADRIASITSDLVDVSRIETGRLVLTPARCDIVALVTEVLDRFRATTSSHRHRLLLVAPGWPVEGDWDGERLDQVFTNLVDNAIKYSPNGGVIEVRIRVNGGQVFASVRDEGVGLAPSALPELFKAFRRGDGRQERTTAGLGLGLHIVRELVAMHGGQINVDSELGRGSTFTVMLPLTAASSAGANGSSQRTEAGASADRG